MPNPDCRDILSMLGRWLSIVAVIAVLAFAPAVVPTMPIPAYAGPPSQSNNNQDNDQNSQSNNNQDNLDNNQNNNNEDIDQNNNNEDDTNDNNDNDDNDNQDNNQNNNNEDESGDNETPPRVIDVPSPSRSGPSAGQTVLAPPVPTEEPIFTGPVTIEVAEPQMRIYPLGTALVETVLLNPIDARQLFALEILLLRSDDTIVTTYLSEPLILAGNAETPAIYTIRHADGAVKAQITPRAWPNLD